MFQNIHRYFLYFALLFIVVLTYDVWVAMWFEDPATGGKRFGIGLGTIILAVNVVLLSGYTFGCHSLRHLIGGRHDELSRRGGAQMSCYNCVSGLNRRHMLFAWCSLFSVAFSDIYVRLVAMGIWSDWRLF